VSYVRDSARSAGRVADEIFPFEMKPETRKRETSGNHTRRANTHAREPFRDVYDVSYREQRFSTFLRPNTAYTFWKNRSHVPLRLSGHRNNLFFTFFFKGIFSSRTTGRETPVRRRGQSSSNATRTRKRLGTEIRFAIRVGYMIIVRAEMKDENRSARRARGGTRAGDRHRISGISAGPEDRWQRTSRISCGSVREAVAEF